MQIIQRAAVHRRSANAEIIYLIETAIDHLTEREIRLREALLSDQIRNPR